MDTTLHAFDAGTDHAAIVRMISLAFGGTPEGAAKWLESAGNENFRVVRAEGAPGPVRACVLRIPMGQYLGGRSVPMVGVAAVTVPPEERGRGIALGMMTALLRELAAERVPISGLYASTQSLYRKVGYEQSAHRCHVRLPWSVVQGQGEFAPVRPIAEGDMPAVKACYAGYASCFDGMLNRGPYVWQRIREWRDATYHGFAVPAEGGAGERGAGERGAIDGYLFLREERLPQGRFDLILSDHAFTTRRAGLGLLRLLSDFSMMAEDISFYGGPVMPLLSLLPQQRYEVARREYAMTRITDLPAAIAARGYPDGVNVEFSLDVDDPIIPSNAGAWRVRVADGRGEAVRATTKAGGVVRLSIGALASVYGGFYSPTQARLMGWLDATDATALAAFASAFPGSVPWMTDMY